MEDGHIGFREGHLRRGEDVGILQADVILLVEEALALDAGHVEDIELRHGLLEARDLLIGDILRAEHLVDDVVRDAQLLGRNQHEADALVPRERLDERVDGAAELEVAAQADGEVGEASLAAKDGHEVGEGLGRVLMAAVSGVDHRDAGIPRGPQRRALLRVAHRAHVGVAGDDADGVGDALALRRGAGIRGREAEDAAAEIQHGGLKAQARAGARLVEERRELFPRAHGGVARPVGGDVPREGEQRVNLFDGKVERIDQMSHISKSPYDHLLSIIMPFFARRKMKLPDRCERE